MVATDAAGNFVVVWSSNGQDPDGSTGVYAQRFNAAREREGSEFRVNTYTASTQDEPAVAMDTQGNSVIVWSSEGQDPDEDPYVDRSVYAQRYDAAGVAQGVELRVDTDNATAPSVAMDDDGNFVVAWQNSDADRRGIFAQRFDATGNPVGERVEVNTLTAGEQHDPSLAVDPNGNFVISWTSFDYTKNASRIYARRFDQLGEPRDATEFPVSPSPFDGVQYSATDMDDQGNFVVTWSALPGDAAESRRWVFAKLYDTGGTSRGDEFEVDTLGVHTSVAMGPEGDFVVAWESTAGDHEIAAQWFDADGNRRGTLTGVPTSTGGGQRNHPSVAMDRAGKFVVTWTGPNDGNDVLARQFRTAFLVNSRNDTTDATPGDGFGRDAAGDTTLRAAIVEANAFEGEDSHR